MIETKSRGKSAGSLAIQGAEAQVKADLRASSAQVCEWGQVRCGFLDLLCLADRYSRDVEPAGGEGGDCGELGGRGVGEI